ncbi:hypothetical protein AAG906_011299 [Vitis piasezkii]
MGKKGYVDYLVYSRSDTYRLFSFANLGALSSIGTCYIKSISTDISTRKITKKSSQPTEQQARQQTRRHRVMVKHVVHQNCRSSVLSGKSPISLKP